MDTISLLDTAAIIAGNNDRGRFDANELQALADSMAANGLLNPIAVRAIPDSDLYQIIAGERRYRAARLLGWAAVPAIVHDMTDQAASAAMLVENTGRVDLDPLEEARAYAGRIADFGWTVERCAQVAGVTTVRVLFRLKLLRLRDDLQALVSSGNLPLGYAQILADSGLDNNFQGLAARAYSATTTPTPAWFRKECSRLYERQAQTTLFDTDPFTAARLLSAPATVATVEPPHPTTSAPPRLGGTPRQIVQGHIAYWRAAAAAWEALGKNFKRQECEAAAAALESTLLYL